MRFVSDELREASQDRIAFLTCVLEEISPDVKRLIPRGLEFHSLLEPTIRCGFQLINNPN
jgi:hypothetical protein